MANNELQTNGNSNKSLTTGVKAPPIEFLMDIINDKPNQLTMTHDEVVGRIQKFFDLCMTVKTDDEGKQMIEWERVPTKTLLCLCLGIDIRTLSRYSQGIKSDGKPLSDSKITSAKRSVKDEDIPIVLTALDVIRDYYEGRLGQNINPAGAIFWLKNLKDGEWCDDKNINFTHEKIEPGNIKRLPRNNNLLEDNCIDLPGIEEKETNTDDL